MPGAAWTLPPDHSHSQVSQTESPNGRGCSPAAFAEALDTAPEADTAGTRPRAELPGREGARRKWPGLTAPRDRLDDIEQASPAQRIDAIDMALVDAPAATAHAYGLLAALTADAYAAMNSYSSLLSREDLACGTGGCSREPIVELWRPDSGHRPAPACREHGVQALGQQPAIKIVAAYQPDVALSVFEQAHGES